MNGVAFNWDISIGDIAIIIGLVSMLIRQSSRIAVMEHKVDMLWKWMMDKVIMRHNNRALNTIANLMEEKNG